MIDRRSVEPLLGGLGCCTLSCSGASAARNRRWNGTEGPLPPSAGGSGDALTTTTARVVEPASIYAPSGTGTVSRTTVPSISTPLVLPQSSSTIWSPAARIRRCLLERTGSFSTRVLLRRRPTLAQSSVIRVHTPVSGPATATRYDPAPGAPGTGAPANLDPLRRRLSSKLARRRRPCTLESLTYSPATPIPNGSRAASSSSPVASSAASIAISCISPSRRSAEMRH